MRPEAETRATEKRANKMKSCAQHYKYFPNESKLRHDSEFSRYSLSKDGKQPNCRRCADESNLITNQANDPIFNSGRNNPAYREQLAWVHERNENSRVTDDDRKRWQKAHPEKIWLTPSTAMKVTTIHRPPKARGRRQPSLAPSMTQYTSAESLRDAVLSAKPPRVAFSKGKKKERVEDHNFYLTLTSMASDLMARGKVGATSFEDDMRPNSPLTYTPYAVGTLDRFKMAAWQNDSQRNEMEKAVRGKMLEYLEPVLASEGLAREVFHLKNAENNIIEIKDAFVVACKWVNAAMVAA